MPIKPVVLGPLPERSESVSSGRYGFFGFKSSLMSGISKGPWQAICAGVRLAGLSAVIHVGCSSGPPSAEEVKRLQPLFVPGYSDVRVERDSLDEGFIIYSYRPPNETPSQRALATIKRRIRESHPCYVIVEEAAPKLHVRCTGNTGRLHLAEEVHVAYGEASRRVFVLTLNRIPQDPRIYKEFVSTLDEAVRRYQAP